MEKKIGIVIFGLIAAFTETMAAETISLECTVATNHDGDLTTTIPRIKIDNGYIDIDDSGSFSLYAKVSETRERFTVSHSQVLKATAVTLDMTTNVEINRMTGKFKGFGTAKFSNGYISKFTGTGDCIKVPNAKF